MKRCVVLALYIAIMSLSNPLVFAQGIGEYGRAVGSVPHGRGITGPGPSRGGSHGNAVVGGVGDVGGRALPGRLIVASKNAGLFPRQDDESEKITQLPEGENLVPMVQSEGTNQWYMVKTQKGLVGWVKSVDVRPESTKK